VSLPISRSAFRFAVAAAALLGIAAPAFGQESAATIASLDAAQPAGEVVLIPNRVIYPRETIALDALKKVTLVPGKKKPDAVATRAEELEGRIAKRTLLPGHYIPTNAIREPWVVEQGAPVQVIFATGPLTISATAVTLEPGSAGDLVKVRNIDSGKIFSGTVMADGTIRVGAS
jgi:flagella basal body P-ring formation protein FlgA